MEYNNKYEEDKTHILDTKCKETQMSYTTCKEQE